MNAVFTYNQELATQIGGGGQYVTESGGYDLKIVRAVFSNNKALEMDFETRDGLKLNYVSINYTKNDGQPNEFGQKMIHAIMGCVGVNQLSQAPDGNIPELMGKFLKAVVQRVDYTKTGGANPGTDGYKFDFKMPAMMNTGKTIKEHIDNKPAEAFAKYAETVTNKDERVGGGQQGYTTQQQAPQQAHPQYNEPNNPIDFDDNIPF